MPIKYSPKQQISVIVLLLLFSEFILFSAHSKMASRPGTRNLDVKKISCELFSLTYGALVVQILKDYEDVDKVNSELDKIGYNIGIRLVEDFLARTNTGKCHNFRDTADKLQLGFKLFLNVQPTITGWNATSDEFSLVFDNNPLGEFVELPDQCSDLVYSNLICGAIRGALEMVHIDVNTWFVQDTLKGSNVTELKVKFVKRIEDAVPPGDED